jgi:hypothetical protein
MTAVDILSGECEGLPTLFAVPALPDNESALVREGLVRRRLATTEGVCPCGARRPAIPRRARRAMARHSRDVPVYSVQIQHENDCPAIHPDTVAAVAGRRWSR